MLSTHIELLQHADHNVRGRAALTLRTLGDVRAVDALIRALCTEPNPFVRENITAALVSVGDAALPPLIQLLGDASRAVRHNAAHALSKIGDARAVDALIDTLQDPDVMVISKAAFALGQIGDLRAIPALVRLLGHESRELQSTLASVLERFGLPAVPQLLETLEDQHWQAREHAAYILGFIGSRDTVPALTKALSDQHWQVRFASVHALGDLGGESAKQAVQSTHNDSDPRVRSLAPKVLKRLTSIVPPPDGAP
jgi:HEAT repeat protein